MFDNYPPPRNWSEMSTDFRLMMGFHLCMMVMFVTGRFIGIATELAIAGSLVAIAVVISIWRKRAADWRWPRIGLKEVAFALFNAVIIGVFAFAMSPMASPRSPVMLPWFLALSGIGFFNVASALRLVTHSEREFLAQCGEPAPNAETKATEAQWRGIVRAIYSACFLAAWLVGVAFFYFNGVGLRDGTRTPTAMNTEPLMDHGRTVYVTEQAKHLIDVLQVGMFAGFPAIMLLGAFLHFGLKVQVFGPAVKAKSTQNDRDELLTQLAVGGVLVLIVGAILFAAFVGAP